MLLELLKPQNGIKLLAGLSGLFFERVLTGQLTNGEWEAVETAVAIGADSPAVKAAVQDDLTLINGIGPTFARRLQAAGITSYAQLAEMTPERVKEIAQLSNWQADPAGWIAQARARSI